MTSDELVEYTRKYLLRDTRRPIKWDDDLIEHLLNDAQFEFCAATHISLRNSGFNLSASQGEAEISLPVQVVHVVSVRLEGASRPMRHLGTSIVPHFASEGRPEVFSSDEVEGAIKLFPTPDADYDLIVRAAVVPERFSGSDTPAIPLRFHTLLSYYAAYHCLMQNEVDGENTAQADKYQVAWERGKMDAHRQVYQMRIGPNAVARPPAPWV